MEATDDEAERKVGPLRLDSIRNKILVLALLATLVPALSTAVLSYVRTRTALTENLESELRGIGSQSARELDLWLKERFYDLRVFVGSFEVTENLDRARRGGAGATEALGRLTNYLAGVQSRSGDYTELMVLDAAGRPVASSSGQLDAYALPEEWGAALARGEQRLGDPYLDTGGGTVVTRVAVPIESADARFLGSLVATLHFEAVGEMLGGLAPGERGHIELISGEGRVIAASSGASGYEPALPDETLARLEGAAGATLEYQDVDGVDMLGTLRRIEPSGWFVLAHLPTTDAYAPITRLRNSTVLLVTFLLLVVGAIAYFIGLFIVRPLDRLAVGARAVAAGDLTIDLPVTGRDEVAYLTGVFNDMVARLRAKSAELEAASATLREQNEELERISMTDALTGLFNRRYVMAEFDKELARAARYDRKLAVLMMDVDKFKQYNDTYGHQAGDEVLAGMGPVIRDATREPDVPARYGGEEFIVLLPDCDLQGAVDAGERIRSRLSKEVFEGGKVTVSIGAAAFPVHGDEPPALIAAADAALYEAKHAGRDRVMAAAPPGEPPAKSRKGAAGRRKKEPKDADG